jgi:hypothetical protein
MTMRVLFQPFVEVDEALEGLELGSGIGGRRLASDYRLYIIGRLVEPGWGVFVITMCSAQPCSRFAGMRRDLEVVEEEDE